MCIYISVCMCLCMRSIRVHTTSTSARHTHSYIQSVCVFMNSIHNQEAETKEVGVHTSSTWT